MPKFLLFFFAFFSFLLAEFDFKPVKANILETQDIYAYINDSEEIKLNSSGVVIQNFENSKSIIARATVIEKKEGLAKLELSVFSALEQSALPLPNSTPKIGDEVILNFLYDRALLIAPNEKSYKEITSNLNEFYFTHIDIFGAELIKNNSAAPKISDFRKFCSNNATGIVIFALKDRLVFADCQDFKILKTQNLEQSDETQRPFYSNIQAYRDGIFNFNLNIFGKSKNKMEDFYSYYENLLEAAK